MPFTASQGQKAELFRCFLLRPLVYPEVKGVSPAKSLEIRFLISGNLVANFDFVESIFGNAGKPNILVTDASLDPGHWTGHSGCLILASQLLKVTKKPVCRILKTLQSVKSAIVCAGSLKTSSIMMVSLTKFVVAISQASS